MAKAIAKPHRWLADSDPLAEANPEVCLPRGTLVGERFEICGLVSIGGFGIVYRAWDKVWRIPVALKEHFPLCAERSADGLSVIPQDNYDSEFHNLRVGFHKQIDLLRGFVEHPTIVAPVAAVEAFGTEYLAFELLLGNTLRQHLDLHRSHRLADRPGRQATPVPSGSTGSGTSTERRELVPRFPVLNWGTGTTSVRTETTTEHRTTHLRGASGSFQSS